MERRREALVGLVVVLGIAVAVVGTIWLQGGLGRDMVEVRAATANVGQLVAGAAVKFRGVSVGHVDAVTVTPNGEAVMVHMSVRPDLVLPPNAAVLLAPESVFGDWQAEILARSDLDLPYLEDYPEEGVLPGAALPDFSRLTATADEIAHNLTVISERFQIAFTEETALHVRSAIENIGEVSDGLSEIIAQQEARFEDLAEGVNASAAELGAAARVARLSFERIDSIIMNAGAETMAADASATLSNLRSLTEELNTSLSDMRSAAQRADTTFARLDALLIAAESGDGSVGKLLGDPALADGAIEAVQELRALLADIQENPRRYLSFSIF